MGLFNNERGYYRRDCKLEDYSMIEPLFSGKLRYESGKFDLNPGILSR